MTRRQAYQLMTLVVMKLPAIEQFTVTLSAASGLAVAVGYSTSNATATAGADYTASNGTLTIAAGATTATFNVGVLADSLDEANETVTLTLSSATNASISDATGTLTITDDDNPPTVDFNATSSSGAESLASTALTVDLSTASANDVTVNYAITGTATGSGTDFTLANGSLTIAAGDTSGAITIASIVNDALDEANETVIVTLTASPTNAALGSDDAHTYTINDNDDTPSLSIADVTAANESAVNKTFTVTLSAASGLAVTVNYATSNGTATAGADYTATSGSLTIAAGATTTTFTVGVLADTLAETNETVTLTLSSASNASISDATATLTITDDDSSVSLSINDVTTSDESAANSTFTVTLSAVSGLAVSFDYATSNGTATSSADYTATSGSLTIAAGATTTTFTVGVLADTLDEDNETVTLTLSGASNATISDATGTLTITDDDSLPGVDYRIASSSGAESLSSAVLNVDLSAVSGKAVTVNYAVTGGTATGSGTDFTLSSGTLTIAAGDSSGVITIGSIVDDSIEEENETVIVTLSSPSNATLSSNRTITSHTYSIRDNDDTTNPTLTVTSPLDDAISVPIETNIVLTFNEEVDVETGNIYIKKIDDDTTVVTFDITSNLVTGTGTTVITLNPTDNLLSATEYYIVIEPFRYANFLHYRKKNFYKTTLNFTTANDDTDPTVVITAQEVIDGDVSGDPTLSITFTLSEIATDFVVGDITLENGALTNFTGSGKVYTATFTPSADGPTTINIAAEKFTDPASNDNVAATEFNWTYYVLLTDPTLKKDVIALMESWTDIATRWGGINIDSIHNRLTWLERNKHTGKTSYQGIRVRFTNQQVDNIMNNSSNSSELDLSSIQSSAINSLVLNKGCLDEDGLLIDQSLRDDASCNDQDYIETEDALKASMDAIESELEDAAINKAVKLRESVIGTLNPSFKPVIDNWSVWTSGEITVGRRPATSTASKQKINSRSIHIGFDKPLENGKGVVGVALGVGFEKTNIGTSTSNVKANNYALSAYGEIYPYEDITLEGIIGVGHIQFDTTRKDGASTLTGSRNADQVFGSLRIKRDFGRHETDLDKKSWSVHPYAKVEMSHTKFEKFSENGSAVTALTFEEQHLNSIRTSVGADAHYEYRTDDKTFRPFVQFEFGKDLSKTSKAPLYYTVQGASYTHNLSLDDRSDTDVKLSLGLAIETNDNLTMSITYTRAEQINSNIGWGHNYTDTFDLKLDWKFGSVPKNKEVINTDVEIKNEINDETEMARQAALDAFQQKLADERAAAAASTAAYHDRLLDEEFAAFESQLEAELAAQEMMSEIKVEMARQAALDAFQQKLADERAAAAASTAAYQAKLAAKEMMSEIKEEMKRQQDLEAFQQKLADETAAAEASTAAYQSKLEKEAKEAKDAA